MELIREENDLKTPGVGAAIRALEGVGNTLREHLLQIAGVEGPVKEFFHQLVKWKREEDRLERVMRDLGNAKMNLTMYIQLANVGLVRGVGHAVQVNIAEVGEINKLLIKKLGSGHVLRISQLLEGKSQNSKTPKYQRDTVLT